MSRAWDWMIKAGHPASKALLNWLLATDKHGTKHANARRLGIMYMIFDRKMWRAYKASSGWQPYSGSNPHTDHVHFSFSWSGANKQTSFWSAPWAAPMPTSCSTRASNRSIGRLSRRRCEWASTFCDRSAIAPTGPSVPRAHSAVTTKRPSVS